MFQKEFKHHHCFMQMLLTLQLKNLWCGELFPTLQYIRLAKIEIICGRQFKPCLQYKPFENTVEKGEIAHK